MRIEDGLVAMPENMRNCPAPLHVAKDYSIVCDLIKAKADIQAETGLIGDAANEKSGRWTALHYAAFHDRPDILNFLLAQGAPKFRKFRNFFA